jgi:hypothetical protein
LNIRQSLRSFRIIAPILPSVWCLTVYRNGRGLAGVIVAR